MTTSGTTSYNPDFTEIAELAWMQAGREMRSGFDLRVARWSMNLLTIEFQNRGLNMFTFEEGSISLVQGTATYNLPSDTIDILDHVIRTGVGTTAQSDLDISRISMANYSTIPNKLVTGRPIQLWVNRAVTTPTVTVWPVPERSSYYTLAYWRMRRIQDAGDGAETADVNFRFLPALIAGLAYQIALKTPELMQRVPMLEAQWEKQYQMAADEDREKAPVRFIPRIRS